MTQLYHVVNNRNQLDKVYRKRQTQSIRVAELIGGVRLTYNPAKAQRSFVLRHSDDEEVEGKA